MSNVAVIIVRIVFMSALLYYCLLLNHSFQTNPNKITNCFKLILFYLQLNKLHLLNAFAILIFWNSQNFASILPLSNYIHTYYQLPHNPIHHVLLSPLENIFYTMHAEYMLVPLKERNRKKENLILIDSDLKNDLFVPEHILGKYSKATLWANVVCNSR